MQEELLLVKTGSTSKDSISIYIYIESLVLVVRTSYLYSPSHPQFKNNNPTNQENPADIVYHDPQFKNNPTNQENPADIVYHDDDKEHEDGNPTA